MKVKYFGAEHCGMCKCLRPRVESWCKEHDAEFQYWDTDSDDAVAIRQRNMYGIRSIPVVVIEDNENVQAIRGIDEWNMFAESCGGNKR